MTKSSIIQENILKFLSDKQEHSVQDIKSYLHDNGVNEYTEGQFAGSINTLMRNDLIKKKGRGIYSIKLGSENMRKCFVISPIGDDGSDVRKRADQVFKYIIAPVCDETGFEPIRVDKLNQPDSITQTIIDFLINSELVIADITGHNPNAFYEMGYRTSTGKDVYKRQVPTTPTCLPILWPTAGDEPHNGAYNVMTAAPGGRTIERRTRWQKYIFLRPITEWIKINVSKTDVTKISTPGP